MSNLADQWLVRKSSVCYPCYRVTTLYIKLYKVVYYYSVHKRDPKMNRSSHMAGPYYVHTKPPVKGSDCQLAISYSPPTQAKFNLELQNRFFKCEEHLVFGTISSLNVVYIKRSVTSHKLSPFFLPPRTIFFNSNVVPLLRHLGVDGSSRDWFRLRFRL